MHLCPILVGVVEIDAAADETFVFDRLSRRELSFAMWRRKCAGNTACAVLAADLPRLRDDLDTHFQQWQARLAA